MDSYVFTLGIFFNQLLSFFIVIILPIHVLCIVFFPVVIIYTGVQFNTFF